MKKRQQKKTTVQKAGNKKIALNAALIMLAWLILIGIYHTHKPLPEGVAVEGKIYGLPESDIVFLSDITSLSPEGERISDQQIFDAIFAAIDDAHEFIILDMFLFNEFQGDIKAYHRNLSSELTTAVLEKKRDYPDISILFITDPVNTAYGAGATPRLEALRKEGVQVIVTDLKNLRDSNPAYSALWRAFLQWFGTKGIGTVPHPFDAGSPKVPLRSYYALLNFKANHRKVLVADDGAGGYTSIISSANPNDASSAHTNVALRIKGSIAENIIPSELAIASFSGGKAHGVMPKGMQQQQGTLSVQFITERAIKDSLLGAFRSSGKGDHIEVVMFYLSDRDVTEELLRASARGAEISLTLDPNKDAFGRRKNGIPNRQVAYELVSKSKGRISIRWYETHGEQNHAKMVLIKKADGTAILILGSANLTKRNLDNLNLEANVRVEASADAPVMQDAQEFITLIKENTDGNLFSNGHLRSAGVGVVAGPIGRDRWEAL